MSYSGARLSHKTEGGRKGRPGSLPSHGRMQVMLSALLTVTSVVAAAATVGTLEGHRSGKENSTNITGMTDVSTDEGGATNHSGQFNRYGDILTLFFSLFNTFCLFP